VSSPRPGPILARFDPAGGQTFDAYSLSEDQNTFLGELVDVDVKPVATDGGHDLYACETPGCDGEKEVITPDGYVCHDCADELAEKYESEEDAKLLTDGGTDQQTQTYHRAVCASCGSENGINRPHRIKVGATVDRNTHNEKHHSGAPVAEVETFEAEPLGNVGHIPKETPPLPSEADAEEVDA